MRALLAATLGLVVLGIAPSPVRPNGGTVRLAKVATGPYFVSAWTQPDPPRVGRLDVSVAVMRPVTEDALLDARVTLTAEAADGKAGARTLALVPGGGGNPLYYHALVEMPAPGRWRVTLAVEGPAGAGQSAFELDVQPPRPLVWALLPGLLVGVGLFWWLVRHSGRRGSAPPGPAAGCSPERPGDAGRSGRA